MHADEIVIQLRYTDPHTKKILTCGIKHGGLTIPEAILETTHFSEDVEVVLEIKDNKLVVLCHQKINDTDVNRVIEPAEVDVIIQKELAIESLYIYTAGRCEVGVELNLPGGLYVHAGNLEIYRALRSEGEITLNTPLNKNNYINIGGALAAKKLHIQTKALNINAPLTVGSIDLLDCSLNISKRGAICINRATTESNLLIIDATISGDLLLLNTQIHSKGPVKFIHGKSKLFECQLFLQALDVDRSCVISGKNSYIDVDDILNVDGTIKIDNLEIFALKAEIAGFIWGQERLHSQVNKSLYVCGVLGSQNTYVKTKCLTVECDHNKEFVPCTYSKGGIIGEKSLVIDSLVTAVMPLARIQGANIHHSCGININFGGMSIAFDHRNLGLVDIPLGLELPYAPAHHHDLRDPDKLLRLSIRCASNYFFQYRPLLAFANFVTPFALANHAYSASRSMLGAVFHDLRHAFSNRPSETLRLGANVQSSARRAITNGYSTASSVLWDPEFRRQLREETTMHDVVNGLIRIKGYYLLGNAIYQVGTNRQVFMYETAATLARAPREIINGVKSTTFALPEVLTNTIDKIRVVQSNALTHAVASEISKINEVSVATLGQINAQLGMIGLKSSGNLAPSMDNTMSAPKTCASSMEAPQLPMAAPTLPSRAQTHGQNDTKMIRGRSKFGIAPRKPKNNTIDEPGARTLNAWQNPGNLGIAANQIDFNNILVKPTPAPQNNFPNMNFPPPRIDVPTVRPPVPNMNTVINNPHIQTIKNNPNPRMDTNALFPPPKATNDVGLIQVGQGEHMPVKRVEPPVQTVPLPAPSINQPPRVNVPGSQPSNIDYSVRPQPVTHYPEPARVDVTAGPIHTGGLHIPANTLPWFDMQTPNPRPSIAMPTITTGHVAGTNTAQSVAGMPSGLTNASQNYLHGLNAITHISGIPALDIQAKSKRSHVARGTPDYLNDAMNAAVALDVVQKELEAQLRSFYQLREDIANNGASPYSFSNESYRNEYQKLRKEFDELLPEYKRATLQYEAEMARLKAESGIMGGALASFAMTELEEGFGNRVFAQAKKLHDLHTAMHSFMLQDIEMQIDATINELAENDVDIERQERFENEVASSIKDYSAKAGLLFGSAIRSTKTRLNGLTMRHQNAVAATALVGAVAAPAAAALSTAVYALMSCDAVEKRMLHALDLAIGKAGVDKYNRADISKAVLEGVKIGAAGAAVRHSGRLARSALASGNNIYRSFKVEKLAQNTETTLLHQFNREVDLTIRSPSAVAIQRGWGELSRRQANLLEILSKPGKTKIVDKNDINVYDLACLTAKVGDEFAMFTLGGKRLIIRGEATTISIPDILMDKLKKENWRWSAHTHPASTNAPNLTPSGLEGDVGVLLELDQEQSMIINSLGRRRVFDINAVDSADYIEVLPKMRSKQ